ncbi:MAG TPA: ribonuclease Y [Gemmatimonadales bacterium]|jgi:ribonuclease Y|nr:ribonuclease Y [Gemmatimonadales bacterium]
MLSWLAIIAAVLGGGIAAGTVFYILGRRVERRAAEAAARAAAAESARLREDERQRMVLNAKEEVMAAREALHKSLDGKLAAVDQRDQELRRREQQLDQRTHTLGQKELEIVTRLERAAGLSAADAKQELVRQLEDAARDEAAAAVRDIKDQAKKGAEREAKKIVALAIQRIAAEQTAESSVSAVPLPSDEMKGRIIGREGRNIRAFEAATGVDVIIDDTPDTVVVSCFDPVRREVGRLALERLIADGRIHPGRIEEIVKKAQAEVDAGIVEAGEQAAYETGIRGLHPELVKLVGRMKYRTSYGQNILEHSKEVAWIAGIMAAELKLDAPLAKRGGLLHDIGKVLTHEHDGTHVQLGVEVATKYGEPAVVINCIAAHHDDVPHESPVSVIVQAADAVSGSRPGARREAFETYVKRLTQLEQLAAEFAGVEKVFAIQAGREVRVVVTPEAVNDAAAAQLTEQIARKIERELQYPGQIRVVVIRETRAVDFAR